MAVQMEKMSEDVHVNEEGSAQMWQGEEMTMWVVIEVGWSMCSMSDLHMYTVALSIDRKTLRL